ncbi:MAG: hypothetical protein COW08_02935 [Ignavibacteriales bacterium CG12_big_fil_rev_8_21_14_0_65_30_8]|nr:MAG: hypothetical protein COW08_02935 [Ignavibacteriales bacterium CG12_big_fil_rev_8_21_14_0_65_30_8]
MKKTSLIFFIITLFLTNLFAQQDVRIMTYNLLNYDSSVDTSRNTYFREIINATNPDILVVEEILNQNSVDVFLSNVMNAVNSNYRAGIFIDGFDTKNAIYYDNTKFQFVLNTVITTELRDINEFKVVNISSNDTLRIYAVHLKASTDITNENKRADEVDSLRKVTDALSTSSNFIVLGDFNIYSSFEPAYIKLTDQTNSGYFIDPISMSGTWNNSIYSAYHTQATRSSFGGLDDRFDMILYSNAINQKLRIEYVTDSTIPFGNDGNHYNKSINDQPNTAVSSTVADALFNASDHLPVYATFKFLNATDIKYEQTVPAQFSLSQNYPNPFNPETAISYQLSAFSFVTLKVYDLLGREVATIVNEEKPSGNYEVKFNAENLSSGIFFYRLTSVSGSSKFVQTKKMILLR